IDAPHVAVSGAQRPPTRHRPVSRRAVTRAPAARLPNPSTLPTPEEGRALPHRAPGVARGRTRAARRLPLRRAAAVTARLAAMLRDAQLWVPIGVLIAGLLVLWWIR